MPQLGESIAEATVLAINIEPGATIVAEQEIMEVETQKATMGVTAPCPGKVLEISAEIDASYPVGAVLGQLEVSEEAAAEAGVLPEKPPEAQADTPHFGAPSEDDDGSATLADPVHPTEVEPTVGGLPVPASATGATYISPRFRARMEELGINASDLASVPGSGAGGRVTVEDFERFMADLESQKMTFASPMRIAVAHSMRRSWARPLATVGTGIVLDAVLAHRKTCDPKPGPALYLIRALAIALAEDTSPAGRLIGERVVHPPAIDIGFAVEVADGVLVPTIKDADKSPLAELLPRYNALVEQARQRRLPREASKPGIATVTNFGTFGIDWATPIPLPEQNLVLGMGLGRKIPQWDPATEAFTPVTEAQMTLSFDHRLLDGGAAGRLLGRINKLLQNPATL